MIRIDVFCDACGECYGDMGVENFEGARALATANGWRCDESWELCPRHRDLTDAEIRKLCPL